MQFLRTLFWVVLAVIAVIFATKNWTPVSINLWGGLVAITRLPVLMLLSFLVGLLPGVLLHLGTRWRMRRRVDAAERTLAEVRAQTMHPATHPAAHPATLATVPSSATTSPIATSPGAGSPIATTTIPPAPAVPPTAI